MIGELFLAIGCGVVLIVSGIIAYVWTRRSYSRDPAETEDKLRDPGE